MKILYQSYPLVKILPETAEDLWYLEKLIDAGDIVEGVSFRRFKTETSSEKKKVYIKLKVDKVSFQDNSSILRVLGEILEGKPEEFVNIGAHHTLEVVPGYPFSLSKVRWLDYHKDLLSRAVKASNKPKLAIAALDDESVTIAILSETGIHIKAEIERKGGGKEYPDESIMLRYYHEVCNKLSEIDVPNILIGGPGFTKDNIYKFCKDNYPNLARRLVLVEIHSPGRVGIQEILSRPELANVLKESRVSFEASLVNKLLEEIGKEGLAAYGFDEVSRALDYGAVETLLIPESFFTSHREESERLMELADKTRAKVHVISEDHDAGKQLKSLGVSAMLRFKF